MRILTTTLAVLALLALATGPASARSANKLDPDDIECCAYRPYESVVWYGTTPTMTIQELAAYCGPILWFSPDEPLPMGPPARISGAHRVPVRASSGRSGGPLPGAPHPVAVDSPAFSRTPPTSRSVIHLAEASGIELDFFYYYPSEEGFGGHQHDVESTEMKIGVLRRDDCPECPLAIVVQGERQGAWGPLVRQHARGRWRDPFPDDVLVEEGKHAVAPTRTAMATSRRATT